MYWKVDIFRKRGFGKGGYGKGEGGGGKGFCMIEGGRRGDGFLGV